MPSSVLGAGVEHKMNYRPARVVARIVYEMERAQRGFLLKTPTGDLWIDEEQPAAVELDPVGWPHVPRELSQDETDKVLEAIDRVHGDGYRVVEVEDDEVFISEE